MQETEKRFPRIQNMANWVVRLVGSAILFVLVWYSLRFTQYMIPLSGYEYPVDSRDSVGVNLCCLAVLLLLLKGGFAVEQKISRKARQLIQRAVLILMMAGQGIGGFLWISSADRAPKGDQESVFKAAAEFLTGNYQALGKRGYCEIYPHQLGLASLEELIFRILGRADYYVLQLLFVGMIMLSVWCVYGMLCEISEHSSCIILGTVLAGVCVAPVFYSCWIYGEDPYVFFALLSGWMLCRYCNHNKTAGLVIFLAAITFAVLFRKNAWILIIAFVFTGGVMALEKKDRSLFLALVLAVLLPNLCYTGIYKMYEARSGYAHAEGLPASGFVYIGLMETEGRFGWDYYNSYATYYENGRDTDRTDAAYRQLIRERWQEMKDTPGYLVNFFKGKVLSQWNAPLYQSLYFNYGHEEVHWEAVTAFFDRLSGEWFEKLLWGADRLQFLVYTGCLFYFLFCVRRESSLLQHVLAVTIIGGFLFSVVWEAKTRYVFPYYMMMFPLAAAGYGGMLERLETFLGKRVKDKGAKGKKES